MSDAGEIDVFPGMTDVSCDGGTAFDPIGWCIGVRDGYSDTTPD